MDLISDVGVLLYLWQFGEYTFIKLILILDMCVVSLCVMHAFVNLWETVVIIILVRQQLGGV